MKLLILFVCPCAGKDHHSGFPAIVIYLSISRACTRVHTHGILVEVRRQLCLVLKHFPSSTEDKISHWPGHTTVTARLASRESSRHLPVHLPWRHHLDCRPMPPYLSFSVWPRGEGSGHLSSPPYDCEETIYKPSLILGLIRAHQLNLL